MLAVFAHPDDAEISAGGTLAKWAAAGRAVHLLVLTNGDRGSQDPTLDRAELARIRALETAEAARVLGLASATVLDVHDGDLENTPEIRAEVVRAIRRVRPSTVLSCDPTSWFFENRYYNHSDHRTAGVIALDAVFPGAGNPHYFTDHLDGGARPARRAAGVARLDATSRTTTRTSPATSRRRSPRSPSTPASSPRASAFFEEELDEGGRGGGRRDRRRHAEAFRVLDLS